MIIRHQELKEINGKWYPVIVEHEETPEEIAQREAQEAKQKQEQEDQWQATPYPQQVERIVRKRYSVSDELAINRQRDTKPDDFATYNNFVEQCKDLIKAGTPYIELCRILGVEE